MVMMIYSLAVVVSDVPRSSLKNVGVAQFSLMNIKYAVCSPFMCDHV